MQQIMNLIGKNAKKASLEKIDTKKKNNVLKKYASLLDEEKNFIIRQNKKDIKFAIKKGLPKNFIDRLTINKQRLNSIKNSIILIRPYIKISKLRNTKNIFFIELISFRTIALFRYESAKSHAIFLEIIDC